jgi:hypothetical protein
VLLGLVRAYQKADTEMIGGIFGGMYWIINEKN